MSRHARIPNPRNGRSEAYLPYSMPPMDEDEGARTGPSSRRPWRQRRAWGGKQRIRGPLSINAIATCVTRRGPLTVIIRLT